MPDENVAGTHGRVDGQRKGSVDAIKRAINHQAATLSQTESAAVAGR